MSAVRTVVEFTMAAGLVGLSSACLWLHADDDELRGTSRIAAGFFFLCGVLLVMP